MIKAKFFSILVIVLMVFSSMGGVSATMTNDTKVIATNYSSNVLYNPTIKEIQNAIDSSDDGEVIVIKGSPTDNGLIKSKKNFNIEGENVPVVLEKGFIGLVNVNDTIIFTSAPRIFGDGDRMPIIQVGIWKNGRYISFLTSNEGYRNLMLLYENHIF